MSESIFLGSKEWHWFSVAQHYGLPTRVLDWTYSPFIAMHFATANIKFDRDGVIWAVNYVKAHELLPTALRQRLELEDANVLTVEMLSESIKSLQELDTLAHEKVAIFFEPPAIDDRIVNQYAFCSIKSDPYMVLYDWLDAHSGITENYLSPVDAAEIGAEIAVV